MVKGKLFSWLRLPFPLQSHIRDVPFSPIFYLFRLRCHSLSAEEYFDDPPFSPVSKTLGKPHQKKIFQNKHLQEGKDSSNNCDPKNGGRLPVKSDLPFDFRYSYSESNSGVEPIGFRETPKFSPFGPGRLDRKWTGTCAPAQKPMDLEKVAQERKEVLGDPLTEEEIAELVERYRHSNCSRQINIGKDGVTHNMLDDIHNHWKRAEAVRIKCLGVPTLDMDNICFHLEYVCRINLVGRLFTVT